MTRNVVLAASLIFAGLLTSCGYHVGGKADTIPTGIQTIAVKPFRNLTSRYKLTDRIPQAINREFIARTRFHVVNDPNDADAVLDGSVTQVNAYPVVFDPSTGKATNVQVSVYLQIYLHERATGRLLYSRQNFEVRNSYEVSSDQTNSSQYFDESNAALDRLSADVARMVVSGILENF